jgi:hypothetical protein
VKACRGEQESLAALACADGWKGIFPKAIVEVGMLFSSNEGWCAGLCVVVISVARGNSLI